MSIFLLIQIKMQSKPHRVYIRRKRCLKEAQKIIYDVLVSISTSHGDEINEKLLNKQALEHAISIEAACWSPKLHVTDAEFENLMISKAHELCKILLNSNSNPKPISQSSGQEQKTKVFSPVIRKAIRSTSTGQPVPVLSVQSTPPFAFYPSVPVVNQAFVLGPQSSVIPQTQTIIQPPQIQIQSEQALLPNLIVPQIPNLITPVAKPQYAVINTPNQIVQKITSRTPQTNMSNNIPLTFLLGNAVPTNTIPINTIPTNTIPAKQP